MARRLLALVLVVSSIAMAPRAGAQVSNLRILPLGDSITAGLKGDLTYRTHLYRSIADTGQRLNMLGPLSKPCRGRYPSAVPDKHHAGYCGQRSDQVAEYASDLAARYLPTVVLIHLGTNDLDEGRTPAEAAAGLRTVVEALRSARPGVEIVLSTIIPTQRDWNSVVAEYNELVRDLGTTMTTTSSKIRVVDANTGFTDDFFRDTLHPNDAGQRHIAAAFFDGLDQLGFIP